MSMSKEEVTVAAAAAAAAEEPEPRRPKCTRCRHHGIIVPQKGHMKFCPFLKCDCWKCYLITQRTQIATLQRNLRKAERNPHEKQQQQQRTSAPHCFSGRKPAAPGTPSASGPDGGARPSLTSGLMSPRSTGAPGSAASMTRSPLDPRGRLALGGEHVAGLGSKELLPLSSSEEGALNAPYFSDIGPTPPLPVIHFPFRMPDLYPSSYAVLPSLYGFYNDSLCGRRIFPHFQQGAVNYPPPQELRPPADCGQVFFTLQPPPLPEPFQEELMPRQFPQPPLPRHSEPDTQELD